eukprot:scaffold2799_cov408-Prasinococcus_capsulatus_cf.AAC.12
MSISLVENFREGKRITTLAGHLRHRVTLPEGVGADVRGKRGVGPRAEEHSDLQSRLAPVHPRAPRPRSEADTASGTEHIAVAPQLS